MGQTINSQERYRAIEFVPVVRMKVDANVAIEVAEEIWRPECLLATNVFGPVRPHKCPPIFASWISLRDADSEILQDSTKKLEVGELYSVDPDVVAELDNHELLLLGFTGAKHVSIMLRREN